MRDWDRDAIQEDLERLDRWRGSGFERHRRAAMALADDLARRMAYLAPPDLLDLARDRGCREPLPEVDPLEASLRVDYPKGEAACREIAERIVDTGILGRDLLSVELHGLVELAYRHEVEHGRMIGDWRTHEEIVSAGRARFRHREVFVQALGLDDPDRYPERPGPV
ncbi:MAG: hypothetical protein PVF68_05895 [Acidobacteriota bacterium]|jgi:hypothetical protein